MAYQLHRQPREHQAEGLRRSVHAAAYAFFYDPRCGKTKEVFDTTILNYRVLPHAVDALLIISYPSGVHRVWVEDELPLDLPPELPVRSVVWRSGKMKTPRATADLNELLAFEGLSVLSINCEALLTDVAWSYVARFLRARRCLVAADESSWAASPGTARTKRLLAIGRSSGAVMRRILDGTPVDESPLDVWAPVAFLSGRGPNLLGQPSFFGFKRRYAVLEEGYAPGGRTFQKVTGYQNMEELQLKLSVFSHRVRRDEISDAPPKAYRKRVFQLSAKQQEVYSRLRDEYVAELGARELPVTHVLDRLTKLAMVARGYYPPQRVGAFCGACGGTGCDDCDGLGMVVETIPLTRIEPEFSPAMTALRDEVSLTRGAPIVVWCRFHQDVDDALATLRDQDRPAVRYDGTIPALEREDGYLAFRGGEVDAVVATVNSGISRGHDLGRATKAIYYSDGYSLRGRRQTEDRTEAVVRSFATEVVDLIAEGTVDEARVEAQRQKRSLAEMLMQDPPTRWL